MNCPDCNDDRGPASARFCPNCGTAIHTPSSSPIANKVIDYRERITKSTQGFVGRQWVRDAVDDFLWRNSMPRPGRLTGPS